jgi:hypothetical protein
MRYTRKLSLNDLLGLLGLHDIRPELKRREVKVKLSDELYEKAIQLDKQRGQYARTKRQHTADRVLCAW